jgi:hypothetical protein
VSLGIEKKVFWFDVTVGDSLTVQIGNATQDLLETALDFVRRHPSFLDGSIEVATGTKFHNFAPFVVFILKKIDSLDDVDVVQSRGDAEFGSQLLDVFLFCFILPPLSKLLMNLEWVFHEREKRRTDLDGVQLFFRSIPLVSKADNGRCSLADSEFLTYPILLREAGTVTTIRLCAAIRVRLFAAACRSLRGASDEFRSRGQQFFEVELVSTAIGRMYRGSLASVVEGC